MSVPFLRISHSMSGLWECSTLNGCLYEHCLFFVPSCVYTVYSAHLKGTATKIISGICPYSFCCPLSVTMPLCRQKTDWLSRTAEKFGSFSCYLYLCRYLENKQNNRYNMAKKFAEHKGLDLVSTNQEILKARVIPSSSSSKDLLRPTVTQVFTMCWHVQSRTLSTATRPCRASRFVARRVGIRTAFLLN